MQAEVPLRCGTLKLRIDRADVGLEDLCGFASRRSHKRGFVFVSKVLGKHYPVRPSVMARMHDRLADKLAELPGPVVLIAMAETATGLGQGIYESWQRRTGRHDHLFLNTTRYRLQHPQALSFDESHSHATEHLLYEPTGREHAELFRRAKTLVLVDDEISTGRTLAKLASAFRTVSSNLAAVHLVCLTDWLDAADRIACVERIGLPTTFHSLLQGHFEFIPNAAFDPGPIPNVIGVGDGKDFCLPRNDGRLGVSGLLQIDLDAMIRKADVQVGQRLLVLGSGEFTYPPFLLARRLETLGWDVIYQSTTRSPLLVDGDITSANESIDNYHDGMPNYLYNVADRNYDRVIIGYETEPLPSAHTLPQMLGATPIYF